MKPLPHTYDVTLMGTPAGHAIVASDGLPDLTTAPPREYDGPGDAWSPEHLLLASVSSCFLFTFRAVAKASRAEFLELEARSSGVVAKVEGVTRFSEIVVRAIVTVPAHTNADAVRRAIEKTSAHCLVSSSLVTPTRIEAEVRIADAYAQSA